MSIGAVSSNPTMTLWMVSQLFGWANSDKPQTPSSTPAADSILLALASLTGGVSSATNDALLKLSTGGSAFVNDSQQSGASSSSNASSSSELSASQRQRDYPKQ
jgi:hypothetical protein